MEMSWKGYGDAGLAWTGSDAVQLSLLFVRCLLVYWCPPKYDKVLRHFECNKGEREGRDSDKQYAWAGWGGLEPTRLCWFK